MSTGTENQPAVEQGTSRVLLFFVALLCLFLGSMILWTAMRRSDEADPVANAVSVTEDRDPPKGSTDPLITRFTLTAQDGRLFESESLAGQVHVINFFFSNCPHKCWVQNLKFGELASELGPEGVKFISISTDPDSDTPEVLNRYSAKLGANGEHWSFLTASDTADLLYIRRIAGEMYMVPVSEDRGHTNRFVLVDKWAKVRGTSLWDDAPGVARLKELMHELLAETEPPAAPDPPRQAAVEDEEDA